MMKLLYEVRHPVLALGLMLSVATYATAQTSGCARVLPSYLSQTIGTSAINVYSSNDPAGVLSGGTAIWNFGCRGVAAGIGSGFPTLWQGTSAASGMINVRVTFNSGRSTLPDGNCAQAAVSVSLSNTIIGTSIVMFEQQANGADCTSTYQQILAT